MSKPRKIGVCGYCGRRRRLTRDHIPPRSFFPKPRTSDLITVPSCVDCFGGWSNDDEYFKAVILTTNEVYEAPAAQQSIESLLRAMENPAKRGFARSFLDSIKEVDVQTEAGLYLGTAPILKIDRDRLNRVAERIVRGLFFHERRHPVPSGYEVIGRVQQSGFDRILARLEGVAFPQVREIQHGVFSYTFKEAASDPDSTVWLAAFYDSLYFVGFTRQLVELRPEECASNPAAGADG